MGPSFGLIILCLLVIAAVMVATLRFMPGWKSALGLFLTYGAGLTYLSLAPPYAFGQMERALLARLDQMHRQRRPGQPSLAARIASYELAARMQLAATDALDLSQESAATLAMYGIGQAPTDSYGRRCLIARRLVERGVRFVQLYINAQIWDAHTNLAAELKTACDRTDQPIAALLRDLKQRGLFERTLVVWAASSAGSPSPSCRRTRTSARPAAR